jgi:hypothetical protein
LHRTGTNKRRKRTRAERKLRYAKWRKQRRGGGCAPPSRRCSHQPTKSRGQMTADHYDGDDWELSDHLLAVIHGASYSRDEVLRALTTCLTKTIVQAGDDEAHVMQMVDASKPAAAHPCGLPDKDRARIPFDTVTLHPGEVPREEFSANRERLLLWIALDLGRGAGRRDSERFYASSSRPSRRRPRHHPRPFQPTSKGQGRWRSRYGRGA